MSKLWDSLRENNPSNAAASAEEPIASKSLNLLKMLTVLFIVPIALIQRLDSIGGVKSLTWRFNIQYLASA